MLLVLPPHYSSSRQAEPVPIPHIQTKTFGTVLHRVFEIFTFCFSDKAW